MPEDRQRLTGWNSYGFNYHILLIDWAAMYSASKILFLRPIKNIWIPKIQRITNSITENNITVANQTMFSDKTLQEIIYPVLKVSLFIVSSFVLLFALNMFLGTKEDYDSIIRDHMWSRVFAKGLVFLIIHSVTVLILFIVSKVCRSVIDKKTYTWLLIIHLCILIISVTVLL